MQVSLPGLRGPNLTTKYEGEEAGYARLLYTPGDPVQHFGKGQVGALGDFPWAK